MLEVLDSAVRRQCRKTPTAPLRGPLRSATTVARMLLSSLQQRMLRLTICCSYVVYAVNSSSMRQSTSAHLQFTPSSSGSAFVSVYQELLCNLNTNNHISRMCRHPYQRNLLTMASGTDMKQLGDASKDFQLLIQMAIQTLVRSDTDGDELVHSYGSASQGLWLNLPAAKELQGVLDRVVLKVRAE